MPLLTLFTAPKPFTNPHIAVIQRNAIRSWLELGKEVEIVLLGEEEGLSETARKLDIKHISNIKKNSSGTPLISSLFETARQVNGSPILAYVNADIILLQSFLSTAKKILEIYDRFLLVGQRWDMSITEDLVFSTGWQERLKQNCTKNGKLHKPMGSDYFIYPRECFSRIPEFAIGRAGWDNWMIYESRKQGYKTIDTTEEIMVIHQDHDYSHLPGGVAHYHVPETDENIRLAGGKRVIFTLQDTNFEYSDGKISRVKWNWKRFFREIEIFPLIKLKSIFLGDCIFFLFHPKKLYGTIRKLGMKKKV